MAMSDTGFESLENLADSNLRIYKKEPHFRKASRFGNAEMEEQEYIELSDPNKHIRFAIVHHFSVERRLTKADFNITSVQHTPKGDYWIRDQFGPFLLRFDRLGKLLEPPQPLYDPDNPDKPLRAPQNPYIEENSTLRVMNAMRAHAQAHGSNKTPVVSPWFVMLKDVESSSKTAREIHSLRALNNAGFSVVVYTVNDLETMNRLLELGVQGIISDRPDLLLEAVSSFDRDGDGIPDYLDANGLINSNLFDAQGHRGARNLRPENTLPAMEAALDYLMPTLETDCGITLDGIPVLNHDPYLEAAKNRKADGSSYEYKDEILVKDWSLEDIQTTFIADKLLKDRPAQKNDFSQSPVAVLFAAQERLIHPYVMPSLQQLFDFVNYYVEYYKNGEGVSHPTATKRWKNAVKVRFNIETKINPRTDTDDRGVVFADRTFDPQTFINAIAGVIANYGLNDRVDIQSFDFRTLLLVHKQFPDIRTVCLFGDAPKVGDFGDGANMQDQNGANTPWLGGLYWPYRKTRDSNFTY